METKYMSLPVVVIPSRNAANLVACLTALRKHEPDCPVIVVDDGVDWSQTPWPDDGGECLTFEAIMGDSPFVFARNVNIGIRHAEDRDVVILNDDALLESPGGFQLLQGCAAANEQYGIIGATTNITGQPLQYRKPYRERGELNPSWGLRKVPHIAFVAVLIPWTTRQHIARLIALGCKDFTDGLDERYNRDYGCDDADYCEQVTRAGLKVAVHDGCYVDHGSLTSTYRGDPRAAKSFAQNYKLLMEKWGKLESQPK